MAVGHLVHAEVHRHRVGVEVGFVVLRVEADGLVAKHERCKDVFDVHEEALVQLVALRFQNREVLLDGLRRQTFIHANTAFARGPDGKLRDAVVMAREAACLCHEVRVGLLEQWQTAFDRGLDGVVPHRLERGRGRWPSLSRQL